jgi:hypothetical protein
MTTQSEITKPKTLYSQAQLAKYIDYLDRQSEDLTRYDGDSFLQRWQTQPVDDLIMGKELGLPLYKTLGTFLLRYRYLYPPAAIKSLAARIYAANTDDPKTVLAFYDSAFIEEIDALRRRYQTWEPNQLAERTMAVLDDG